ncbi:MAG: FMN-binding protein [Gemmatimonadaceae bacterium]
MLAAYTAGFVRTRAVVDAAAARNVPRGRRAEALPDGAAKETTPPPRAVDSTATPPTPRAATGVTPVSTERPSVRAAERPAATDATSPPVATTPPTVSAPVLTPAPAAAASAAPPTTPVALASPPTALPPSDTAAAGAAAKAQATAAPAGWRDGTWSGWGTSRHGDIEATVLVEKGRITAAAISQCLTRYSCSWIAHLQGQVVARQSAEVDNVSGATESANAFYYAAVEALKKAK